MIGLVTGTMILSGCTTGLVAPYGTEEGSGGAHYTDLTVGSPLKDNPNAPSLKKGKAWCVATSVFRQTEIRQRKRL